MDLFLTQTQTHTISQCKISSHSWSIPQYPSFIHGVIYCLTSCCSCGESTYYLLKYCTVQLCRKKRELSIKYAHEHFLYSLFTWHKICFSGGTVWALIRSVMPSIDLGARSLFFQNNYREHHYNFLHRLFNCKTHLMLYLNFFVR